MPTYMLSVEPYLDEKNKTYCKIISVNIKPDGPLMSKVSRIKNVKLSPFKGNDNDNCYSNCKYAIRSFCDCHSLMNPDEIPELFNFLLSNGYSIDSNLTKMMNKSKVQLKKDILCFITY